MPAATRLVVIGGGNMGSAIARAAFVTRTRPDDRVLVAETDPAKRAAIETEHAGGLATYGTASEAIRDAGLGARIVLAVKPQAFPTVAAEIVSAKVLRDQLFISIMAGVRIATVDELLGGGRGTSSHTRVLRAMPNLAIAHGEGVTAISNDTIVGRATQDDRTFVAGLFSDVGSVVEIAEDLFDAFTALAGSGPAYVFYLAEALERAAAELGFTPQQASLIVRQTILGSAEMLRHEAKSGATPAQLRARVTSKGGTTEAAVGVLDRAAVMDSFIAALKAGRDRGRELSSR